MSSQALIILEANASERRLRPRKSWLNGLAPFLRSLFRAPRYVESSIVFHQEQKLDSFAPCFGNRGFLGTPQGAKGCKGRLTLCSLFALALAPGRDTGPAGLQHDQLTHRVFEQLGLQQTDYCSNPNARFQALANAQRAFRNV